MNVSTPSRLSDLHLPDMPERPTFDMPEFEMPDIDVPKALTSAATAVGLIRPARPRWPYALGAGLLLAGVAVVAMNWSAVRARLDAALATTGEWIAQMRASRETDEAVAFTAAPTAPIEPSELTGGQGTDYPEGFGATNGTMPDAVTESEHAAELSRA